MLQLACEWTLAHKTVHLCRADADPGGGAGARPVENKRAELAALPHELRAERGGVDAIRSIGDNTGCMALKGASLEHQGAERADAWLLNDHLAGVARRWRIEPARDLVKS